MASILGIGNSALAAAQIGLATTGHNIANASTPGYSRQVANQAAVAGQSQSYGFPGSGTSVVSIDRVYDQLLTDRVVSTQSTKSQIDTYTTQVQYINGLLADSSSGLSPSLQDFFKGVQDLSADPNGTASRQSMLSSAESLASRFQSMDGQLRDIGQGVNSQIVSSVNDINVIATQISNLNGLIELAQTGRGDLKANDLLDQRDQAVNELSKQVKVNVVEQGNSFNVFMGSGQALVIGTKTNTLQVVNSADDPKKLAIAYNFKGTVTELPESAFGTGGTVGGLFAFRTNSLDTAANALGRIAISLGSTFNAQHMLGQDQTGAIGVQFFNIAVPEVAASSTNSVDATTGAPNGTLAATISDLSALTTSNYKMTFNTASDFTVTRLSDGVSTNFTGSPQTPVTVDGVSFALSGSAMAGDSFTIRPTVNGASEFSVAIKDTTQIAAAAPLRSVATPGNLGSAVISAPVVSSIAQLNTVSGTLTYSGGTLTGFPAMAVDVAVNGATTSYASGTPVPYTSGATISYGGASFKISGTPKDGDTFDIGANTDGVGDSRNAVLLGALQSTNVLDKGTSTYQSAYSKLVNTVGSKTRELQATGAAASSLFTQAVSAQQSVSGVNLDEEASNMIRYQQAYQAAGKLMQTASTLFDVLLTLGR